MLEQRGGQVGQHEPLVRRAAAETRTLGWRGHVFSSLLRSSLVLRGCLELLVLGEGEIVVLVVEVHGRAGIESGRAVLQCQTETGQLDLHLIDRLRTEVADVHQVGLAARQQLTNGVHAFALQAVVRANRQIELLDRSAQLLRLVGVLRRRPDVAAGEAGGDYGMNLPEFVARYVPEMASIVKLRDTMFDTARTGAAASIAKARRNLHINAAVGVLVLLIEISVFLLIRWRVLKPLLTSTSAVVAIAAGKLDTPLRVTTRTDEIGDMQRAISDLRHTSADKRRLEREQWRQRMRAMWARPPRPEVVEQSAKQFEAAVQNGVAALLAMSLWAVVSHMPGVTTVGGWPAVLAAHRAYFHAALDSGVLPRAFKDKVTVTRRAPGGELRFKLPLRNPVRPGDTITVGERWF